MDNLLKFIIQHQLEHSSDLLRKLINSYLTNHHHLKEEKSHCKQLELLTHKPQDKLTVIQSRQLLKYHSPRNMPSQVGSNGNNQHHNKLGTTFSEYKSTLHQLTEILETELWPDGLEMEMVESFI